ncbi:MAG: rhomboid family intramembrane serine protease, partial [Aquisalimonadaceae bacterium]
LHGGADHLIGNMVFLVLVGFLVEMTIGAPLFLATYLLGGVLAGGADLIVAAERFVPGVGASGAIAAMMGLYSVLFSRQRVRFFYSVGIWFDYVRAPAIILLPLWLGWELLSWYLYSGSNVNYAAHAAGLTVGAIGGLAIVNFLPQRVNKAFLQAPDVEQAEDEDRALADQLLRELDFDAAMPVVQRLLEKHPHDPELLRRLHQCARIHPDSDDYHRTVTRILGESEGDQTIDRLVLDVYRDYRTRAMPRPRLSGRLIQSLALRFSRRGHLAEAEQLAAVILPRRERFPATPGLLVALAEGHARAGNPARAQPHLEQVIALYPGSNEAELARRVLRRLH